MAIVYSFLNLELNFHVGLLPCATVPCLGALNTSSISWPMEADWSTRKHKRSEVQIATRKHCCIECIPRTFAPEQWKKNEPVIKLLYPDVFSNVVKVWKTIQHQRCWSSISSNSLRRQTEGSREGKGWEEWKMKEWNPTGYNPCRIVGALAKLIHRFCCPKVFPRSSWGEGAHFYNVVLKYRSWYARLKIKIAWWLQRSGSYSGLVVFERGLRSATTHRHSE